MLPNNSYCSQSYLVECISGMILYDNKCYTVVPQPSSERPSFISIILTNPATGLIFTTPQPGSFSNWRYREYGENCSLTPPVGDLGCRPGFACLSKPSRGFICSCLNTYDWFDVRTGRCLASNLKSFVLLCSFKMFFFDRQESLEIRVKNTTIASEPIVPLGQRVSTIVVVATTGTM